MANYEINEEQEVLTKAMRMIETGDPVHADVYNALFSALLNNDVFLEKLANKMVQQAMVSHVMDSTNSNMVLGADQGPVITKLIDKVQEQVTVLNTKTVSFGSSCKHEQIITMANVEQDYTIPSDGQYVVRPVSQTDKQHDISISIGTTTIYQMSAKYIYQSSPVTALLKKNTVIKLKADVGDVIVVARIF